MDLLSSAAAAGLRSRTEALEMLANNIANAQTSGFKADRELYSKYQTGEAWDAHTGWLDTGWLDTSRLGTGRLDTPVMPDIDNHWTDFAQGPLQVTGNNLDLALQGRGFFVVEGSGGNRLMTRDGHFRLSPQGRLETTDGYAVLGVRVENGERKAEPLMLDPRLTVEIGRDGAIRQPGAAGAAAGTVGAAGAGSAGAGANAGGNPVVGQLLLTDPTNPQLLPKRSGNYFSLDPRFLEQAPRTAEVQQGKLEGANFSPAEAAVRLVNVMRQFETLQRAMQLGGEMSRRAVEEVARVS